MATQTNKEIEVQTKKSIDQSSGEPTRGGLWFQPPVDIFETATEITVRADLPGVPPAGLDVDLKDDVLTITGSVEPLPANRRQIYREYDVGSFSRQFRLGEAVDQKKIAAKLVDGVLTVTLPKGEKAKPRKITVSV
jgi:HSP20 family protein